jgi:hypothetical protein
LAVSTPSKNQTPTNKTIAKAAKAGTSKARTRANVSWSYWGSVIGICIAGIALVVGSVIGKSIAVAAPYVVNDNPKTKAAIKALRAETSKEKKDPKKIAALQKKLEGLQADSHWHAAYGVYKCDAYLGKIVAGKYRAEIDGTAYPDPEGIHAHDDGLIHIHPGIPGASGRRAVLGKFLSSIKTKISSNEISYPAIDPATSVEKQVVLNVDKMTCLDKKKKKVKPIISVFLWRDIKKASRVERYTGDFKRIPLVKEGAYAFAISSSDQVPDVPPSEKSLEAPVDLPQPGTTTETVVAGETPTTVKGTATTIKGTATTVKGTATTVKSASTSKAPTSAAPTTKK